MHTLELSFLLERGTQSNSRKDCSSRLQMSRALIRILTGSIRTIRGIGKLIQRHIGLSKESMHDWCVHPEKKYTTALIKVNKWFRPHTYSMLISNGIYSKNHIWSAVKSLNKYKSIISTWYRHRMTNEQCKSWTICLKFLLYVPVATLGLFGSE